MSYREGKSKFTVYLDDLLHTKFKVYCAEKKTNMAAVIREMIKERLKKEGYIDE
ncbi:MAG: hypothetical protein GY739_21820 [Mesoflavibacter sp.]|nr:hypothetical protein [Mesoflavibacter sp.]